MQNGVHRYYHIINETVTVLRNRHKKGLLSLVTLIQSIKKRKEALTSIRFYNSEFDIFSYIHPYFDIETKSLYFRI